MRTLQSKVPRKPHSSLWTVSLEDGRQVNSVTGHGKLDDCDGVGRENICKVMRRIGDARSCDHHRVMVAIFVGGLNARPV